MSSSCISGGGRAAYRALDLEIIKSPSSNSWLSNSSSPSSTLSESSNSPLAISTRKPRTPRKRPNQTYNEAAAILSTAHPKIFPTKHLTKFAKPYVDVGTNNKNPFLFEPNSDLLMLPFQVFDTSGFLLQQPPIIERTHRCSIEPKGSNNLFEKQCQSPGEITSYGNSDICNDYCEEDFDAESILDEEIEEGILDSIMGNLDAANEQTLGGKFIDDTLQVVNNNNNFCYGYPVGLGFDYGNGMRRETSAIRHVDEGDWWRFPSVNLVDITPKIAQLPLENKKKKKKKKMVEIKNLEDPIANKRLNTDNNNEECAPKPNVGLNLKLNYDGVLNAWSNKASPFSGDSPVAESAGNDVQARLAQIDLFSDNGGREAIVLRYKEKRRTRLFSKKIRYQVRKVNADRRPRMKGRFVRSPNSPDNEQG